MEVIETAIFQYKCDNFYAPEADGGIYIKDDTLALIGKSIQKIPFFPRKTSSMCA